MNNYFHPLFSKLQRGFRKVSNVQHCSLVSVEKCRETLDKRGYAGILLIDWSKTFGCINHELLIGKLHAYDFSLKGPISGPLFFNIFFSGLFFNDINIDLANYVDDTIP